MKRNKLANLWAEDCGGAATILIITEMLKSSVGNEGRAPAAAATVAALLQLPVVLNTCYDCSLSTVLVSPTNKGAARVLTYVLSLGRCPDR